MLKTIKNTDFFESVLSLLLDGQSVTIPVKGWSMGPFLRSEKDNVTIAPVESLGRDLKKGDIVLFIHHRLNGDIYVMHRIISINDDMYTLRGDNNPLNMKEYCRRGDIMGVIVSCRRDGKVYKPSSIKWRVYRWLILFYRFIS